MSDVTNPITQYVHTPKTTPHRMLYEKIEIITVTNAGRDSDALRHFTSAVLLNRTRPTISKTGDVAQTGISANRGKKK